MMQVENEYGSYGMEKAYLRQTKQIMEELGIEVPLLHLMALGKRFWMRVR